MYNIWVQFAELKLSRLEARKRAIESTKQQIEALQTSIKCASTDKIPVQGGGSHIEDTMLNNMVERAELQRIHNLSKSEVETVEKALETLPEGERKALELFYICKQKNCISRLKEELNLSCDREAYRLRDKALYRFVLNFYGEDLKE